MECRLIGGSGWQRVGSGCAEPTLEAGPELIEPSSFLQISSSHSAYTTQRPTLAYTHSVLFFARGPSTQPKLSPEVILDRTQALSSIIHCCDRPILPLHSASTGPNTLGIVNLSRLDTTQVVLRSAT